MAESVKVFRATHPFSQLGEIFVITAFGSQDGGRPERPFAEVFLLVERPEPTLHAARVRGQNGIREPLAREGYDPERYMHEQALAHGNRMLGDLLIARANESGDFSVLSSFPPTAESSLGALAIVFQVGRFKEQIDSVCARTWVADLGNSLAEIANTRRSVIEDVPER